ncbi:hypothetical protein GGI05_004604 [Coemansia sp. RSA 2603]|nr:hypothetical protein GGI05_004604 [Coemansia sp. RSA 2603]
MRGTEFGSQQRPRPATARSRLSQGLGGSSLKETHYPGQLGGNSPYLSLGGGGLMNDSRISLLSMIGLNDEPSSLSPVPLLSADSGAESQRLSLGPIIKNTRSSRVLSNEHRVPGEAGRPRSRTQSSEVSLI